MLDLLLGRSGTVRALSLNLSFVGVGLRLRLVHLLATIHVLLDVVCIRLVVS